jgi:hypothetical protein
MRVVHHPNACKEAQMRNVLLALLAVGSLDPRAAHGQGKPASVRGAWQVIQVTMTGPSPRTISIPDPRPNLAIFTAKHYSHLQVESDGPRPVPADMAKATVDELRAVWGPFSGDAGTYEIGDNTMTLRPIVAKNPAAMAPGAFTTYTIKLQGDTLWITEQRTNRSPIANPVTLKAVRVE